MRKALLEGFFVSVVGLGLGALAWLLTGRVWVTLSVGVLAVVPRLCWLRSLADTRLADARERHDTTLAFLQRVLDVVPMPIYVKDAESRVIIVNRAQCERWELSQEAVIGTPSTDLASPGAEHARVCLAEDQRVLDGELIYKEEHMPNGEHGREQSRVITKRRCEDIEGKQVIVCASFDISQWRQAEREVQKALAREVLLRERNQDFIQRVLDVIPDPFYIKDGSGRLVMVNEAYARERGHSPQSIIGKLATAVALNPELSGAVVPEDEAVLRGETIDKEQRHVVPLTGEERFRQISKRPCVDMDGKPLIVVAHFNITRWKVAEDKLARMANEDELTGLPNRRRFLAEAERVISSANRHGSPLALIIFDLDHFKRINDEHGHVVGDEVLREVARRLLAQLRTEDLPCRWGGEEFVILLPMTDLPMAMPLAERLREAFAKAPISVDGLSLALTISGGVAQKQDEESLSDCLARADKVLYAAKNTGRNRFLQA